MNISCEKQMLNIYSLSNLPVIDQQGLLEKFSTFLDKLDKLDLQPVAKKLMSLDNGYGWTAQQTEWAISLYKNFLCLHFLFPDIQLVPTKEIDEVWHMHILLNTYKYIQDSQELYGHILHHYSPIDETLEQYQHYETFTKVTKFLLKWLRVSVLQDSKHQLAAYLTVSLYNPSLLRSACLILPKM